MNILNFPAALLKGVKLMKLILIFYLNIVEIGKVFEKIFKPNREAQREREFPDQVNNMWYIEALK